MPDGPDERTLIVIPAYNEAGKITDVLADLNAHVPSADVVVVDDGSVDNTSELARRAGAAVLRLPFNLGIGGALQTGYLYAHMHDYDVAVQFDGDGQHRADQIEALTAPVRSGEADMAIGSRMMGLGDYRFPLMRGMGSKLIAGVTWLVSGRRITDPTSGFRAYSRRAIAFYARHYPQMYLESPQVTTMALRQGMGVREVPALMKTADHSSIGSVKGVFHAVRVCLALLVDRLESTLPEPPLPERNEP